MVNRIGIGSQLSHQQLLWRFLGSHVESVGVVGSAGGIGERAGLRPQGGAKPEFTLLAHARLQRGGKVTVDDDTAAALARAFQSPDARTRQFELSTALPLQRADYVDPLLGGRWLAAFAPVGATGYVVLGQTRDAVAIRPSEGSHRIGQALAVGSGLLLTLWSSFYLLRRRRMVVRS